MRTIAFYDAKPYDRTWFDRLTTQYILRYIPERLTPETVHMARDCEAVSAFVNDIIDETVIQALAERGVHMIAMRCAGYNNVDLRAASEHNITVSVVPAYSPHAVAEHAAAMLLTLNRHIHKAYNRTREFNFSINGLVGRDLYGKTVGVIGTGRIGQAFIEIMRGFGMRVLGNDQRTTPGITYVDIPTLFAESDVVSLHCPLTLETRHIVNEITLQRMKPTAILINTSRGGLIDSAALLHALRTEAIGGACLDVYEEETDIFYEDNSDQVNRDERLASLVTMPNVIVTSHQAFLTDEALSAIARETLTSMDQFFAGETVAHAITWEGVRGAAT